LSGPTGQASAQICTPPRWKLTVMCFTFCRMHFLLRTVKERYKLLQFILMLLLLHAFEASR